MNTNNIVDTRLDFLSISCVSISVESSVLRQIPHYATLLEKGMVKPIEDSTFPTIHTLISMRTKYPSIMALATKYQRFCILNPNQAPRPRVFNNKSKAADGYKFIKSIIFLGITPTNFDVLLEITWSPADFDTLMKIANLIKLDTKSEKDYHEPLIKLMLLNFPPNYHKKPFPYPEIMMMLIPKFRLHSVIKPDVIEIYNVDSGKLLLSAVPGINHRVNAWYSKGFTRDNIFAIATNKTLEIIDPFSRKIVVIEFPEACDVKTSRTSALVSLQNNYCNDSIMTFYKISDGTPCEMNTDIFYSTGRDICRFMLNDKYVAISDGHNLEIKNLKTNHSYNMKSNIGDVIRADLTHCGRYVVFETWRVIYLGNLETSICTTLYLHTHRHDGTRTYSYYPVKSCDLSVLWFLVVIKKNQEDENMLLYSYDIYENEYMNRVQIKHIFHSPGTISISEDNLSLSYATAVTNCKSEWVTVSIESISIDGGDFDN